MIAMALAADPRLLIADEPTTALDVTTQAQILDLLRDLQQRNGMAIMLITHDLGVIAEMADDVVVMYLGRVVEEGAVDDIFHAPKHPYTRALLRSIPSVDAPPRRKLPTISGSIPHPYNRPPGCPFHTRCPEFMPGLCNVYEPALALVGPRRKRRASSTREVRAASGCAGTGARPRCDDCRAVDRPDEPALRESDHRHDGPAPARSDRDEARKRTAALLVTRPAAMADSRDAARGQGLTEVLPDPARLPAQGRRAGARGRRRQLRPSGAARRWRWWVRAAAARRRRRAASCGRSRRRRARSCSAPTKAPSSTSRRCRAISSVPCAARCR